MAREEVGIQLYTICMKHTLRIKKGLDVIGLKKFHFNTCQKEAELVILINKIHCRLKGAVEVLPALIWLILIRLILIRLILLVIKKLNTLKTQSFVMLMFATGLN